MRCLLALATCALLIAAPAKAFDHQHAAWTALLERHVAWNAEGTTTTVDYAGFASDRGPLKTYLDVLSAVPRTEFDRWRKPQRDAFLINAYNAFTVELVLTRYPDLASIKDLGSLLRSPWKQRFFVLLGDQRHLDEVEHALLRGAPDFDEPRIHFAVNCASIGCPALRPEAFTADRLDAQLEDQTVRFLRDRSRNRFEPTSGVLTLSKIFDWYAGDFERGFRGTRSTAAFAGLYAAALGDDPDSTARVASGAIRLAYSDYDWALNRRAATP